MTARACGLGANIRRMNADPVMRARISAACREGMRRWWDGRRLPPMTPQQRWKYRVLREAVGREAALRMVLS
jgi:hypothetical protein